jgi:cobalt/nickel transport system permease protein
MRSLFSTAAGMNRLERLADSGATAIHRMHPMAKLITTVVYAVAVVSFSPYNLSGLVPLVLYPVILMALSETPYKPLLGRLAVALPFSLAGCISNIIFLRQPLYRIGSIIVTAGEVSCVSIFLKTVFTVMAVLLLAATTSFTEIGAQLVRLHVPKIFCLQLIMTYRYISVLLGEAVSMYTAYSLRSGGGRGVKLRDMGNFLGQLMLRAFDRADRVYQAMKCRGFDGVYRGKLRGGMTFWQIVYTAALSAAIIMLRFVDLSELIGRAAALR